MKNLPITTTALMLGATAAFGGEFKSTEVLTHPSLGEVTVVEDAASHLSASEDGVFASIESHSLEAGSAHTLWFVTITNPGACATSPCSGKDVLKNADGILADVAFAGGLVADETGFGKFATHQNVGALKNGWFGHGFAGAETSEIHLIIKNHGPVIEGRGAEMLGTFRDACTEESIPKAFPPIARADGTPGPNTCAMVQFSVFTATQPDS